jgi:hypothetical protein
MVRIRKSIVFSIVAILITVSSWLFINIYVLGGLDSALSRCDSVAGSDYKKLESTTDYLNKTVGLIKPVGHACRNVGLGHSLSMGVRGKADTPAAYTTLQDKYLKALTTQGYIYDYTHDGETALHTEEDRGIFGTVMTFFYMSPREPNSGAQVKLSKYGSGDPVDYILVVSDGPYP